LPRYQPDRSRWQACKDFSLLTMMPPYSLCDMKP
jgi:hypothetical protein